MLLRLSVILFCLSICGCDFSQPVMPTESQEPIETQNAIEPKAKKITQPPPPKSTDLKTPKSPGQNPEKSFNDFRRTPVKGKAKLTFPPENLLDR